MRPYLCTTIIAHSFCKVNNKHKNIRRFYIIYGYFLQHSLLVLGFFVYFDLIHFNALTRYLCTNVFWHTFFPNTSVFSKYYLFFAGKMRIIHM